MKHRIYVAQRKKDIVYVFLSSNYVKIINISSKYYWFFKTNIIKHVYDYNQHYNIILKMIFSRIRLLNKKMWIFFLWFSGKPVSQRDRKLVNVCHYYDYNEVTGLYRP